MKAQTIGLDSIPSNLAIDLTDELSSDVRGGVNHDTHQSQGVNHDTHQIIKTNQQSIKQIIHVYKYRRHGHQFVEEFDEEILVRKITDTHHHHNSHTPPLISPSQLTHHH